MAHKITKILPIAFLLILIAIAVAALISFARVVFFSGNGSSSNTVDVSKEALLSTSADRSVVMSVRGKIVASEDFRSYEIVITPSSRTITTYKGYQKEVLNSVRLDNSPVAYEQLVNALYKANFMKGTQLEGDSNNKSGVCATGTLYDFKIQKGGSDVKELWTSSCSGSRGSLSANLDQITNLFIVQIPDAEDIINDLW